MGMGHPMTIILHLVALLLAAIALWSMRHELSEKAASRFEWALPPLLALIVAAVLLIVSPGKRFELWIVGIVSGFAIGLIAGTMLKVEMDFAQKLVRTGRPTWDGVAAAALVLLLTVARLVTSDLMNRSSGKFGVLGAAAVFLAAYLAGRLITVLAYSAPKSIHRDMVRGRNPLRSS